MTQASLGTSVCLFCSSRQISRSLRKFTLEQLLNPLAQRNGMQYRTIHSSPATATQQGIKLSVKSAWTEKHAASRPQIGTLPKSIKHSHSPQERSKSIKEHPRSLRGREHDGKNSASSQRQVRRQRPEINASRSRPGRQFGHGSRPSNSSSTPPRSFARKRAPLVSMEKVVSNSLDKMQSLLHDKNFRLETGLMEEDAETQFTQFRKIVGSSLETDSPKGDSSNMYASLYKAYSQGETAGVYSQLKFMLSARVANARFKQNDIVNQIKLADLRFPIEWYPHARKMNRTIHLHIGPTNSGKTYNALKKLEEAESGVYAGPLRLLAHEVYTRLNAKGKSCNLVTGDEMIVDEAEEAPLASCTVEMVPFSRDLDVAVIDEIQMIGDESRGWAWTQALLGLRAKELHLCGEARTLPLIREIAASIGEKLIVHNYERLSPLQVAPKGLDGKLANLQKGDCVVSFSRKMLHSLKREIEAETGKEVAIVYGALPPEIRAQQASLFNDQNNNYDILVASDAIGMGLNLSIKRIIFETVHKFNGMAIAPVSIPMIKQIGGRAGRYRTASQDNAAAEATQTQSDAPEDMLQLIPPKPPAENMGFVTALQNGDLGRLRRAMGTEPPPITSAGLKPPEDLITRFSAYFPPSTPLSYILLRLNEISRVHPRYKLCQLRDPIAIADAIQQVDGLTTSERMLLCYAPVDPRNEVMRPIIIAMARCVAARSGGGLLDIPEIRLEVLDKPEPSPAQAETYITLIAATHQAVVLYLWLSYRLPNIFHSQALAFHTKGLLQEKLDAALSSANLNKVWLQNRLDRIKAKQQDLEDGESANEDGGSEHEMGAVDDHDDPSLVSEVLENGRNIGKEEMAQKKVLDFIPPSPETSYSEEVRGS